MAAILRSPSTGLRRATPDRRHAQSYPIIAGRAADVADGAAARRRPDFFLPSGAISANRRPSARAMERRPLLRHRFRTILWGSPQFFAGSRGGASGGPRPRLRLRGAAVATSPSPPTSDVPRYPNAVQHPAYHGDVAACRSGDAQALTYLFDSTPGGECDRGAVLWESSATWCRARAEAEVRTLCEHLSPGAPIATEGARVTCAMR